MSNWFDDNDSNLIKISELLDLFDLKLELSPQVLNLYVDACLKESRLNVENGTYIFKFDDYSIIINPSDFDNTIIESQDGNISEGIPSGICCYNSKGSVTCIS